MRPARVQAPLPSGGRAVADRSPPPLALELERPSPAADAWAPGDALGPSPMSTTGSERLEEALWRPAPAARRAPPPAEEVSDIFRDVARRHPSANLVSLVGADLGRKMWRNRVRVGLAGSGFVLGFLAAQGLLVEAGFNRLLGVKAWPFNPDPTIDHRGQAAAMVGWALAGGIASSILFSSAFDLAGSAIQRCRHSAERGPPSPLADLLVDEGKALVGRHKNVVAPAFVLGLLGYIVPVCVASQAAFDLNLRGPVAPFNRDILRPNDPASREQLMHDRTVAGVLFGFGLTFSVVGLMVGVSTGIALGRAGRWLYRRAC